MNFVKVKIPQLHKEIYAEKGSTLLNALRNESINIYSPCGGEGTCGKCKVRIMDQSNEISNEETLILSKNEIENGTRLACKVVMNQNIEVYYEDHTNERYVKGLKTDLCSYELNPDVRKIKVDFNLSVENRSDSIIKSMKKSIKGAEISLKTMRKYFDKINYENDLQCVICMNELIDVQPYLHSNENRLYGVAVDIGTTTVACYLIDLVEGIQVNAGSIKNPQVAFGADVISRINFTLNQNNGLDLLRKDIIFGIDKCIKELSIYSKVDSLDIYRCIIVGNTTMIHLFWGLSCKSLSQLPFNALVSEQLTERAYEIGLSSINPMSMVTTLPGIAGFVGSDTVSAMIAAEMDKSFENQILIDLGTNGEIVLKANGAYYACSTAAGPAFEGAKIQHGMQAFTGAIDSITIEDDLRFTTVGNVKPKGICGSGLISAVSEFVRLGVIKESGKISNKNEISNKMLSDRIIENGRHRSILLVKAESTETGREIILSQKDIRELQLAKGAIRAGIEILMKTAQIDLKMIDKLILTGAFGIFVNKECARRIGVFPHLELNRIISLNNGAGEGAKIALCNIDILNQQAELYCSQANHIEISVHPDFQDAFINGMSLK